MHAPIVTLPPTMLASPQQHGIHAPSSFSMNFSTSNLSLKSSRSSRKHSVTLSNTMGWLSRHSTQSSVSSFYKGSKSSPPESERKQRSIELVSDNVRVGPLGSGATVVGTPAEALGLPVERNPSIHRSITSASSRSNLRPALQRSVTSVSKPSNSALPEIPIDYRESSAGSESDCDDIDGMSWPTPPSHSSPLPSQPSLRPSLKSKSQSSIDVFQVPALPAHVTQSPRQPPFEPILISNVPTSVIDFSTVLVTLETCTTTYKSTLKSLTSRPSQLSSYLYSLFPRPRQNSNASSIYSTASDDMFSYRDHLASQGLVPQAPVNIHIFLDRPSAPYIHILNYLRSPVGTADATETLPRAAQLHPANSQSRLEALLELRDECKYLQLDDLYRLCSDEIRQRRSVLRPRLPRSHSRGQSSNSSSVGIDVESQSQHTSLSSMHTLLERSTSRTKDVSTISEDRESVNEFYECSTDFSPAHQRLRSPPTPESWKDGRYSGSSARSRNQSDTMRSPPAGWI